MENEIKHIRLSNHATDNIKKNSSTAIEAADKVADAGGSPRAQIDAAREASGKKLTYTAHIGKRQREKALARMNKNASST